jgi:hypothetical protein
MGHYKDENIFGRPQVVQSNVVAVPDGITIMPPNSRAGHAERDSTINHLKQAAEHGYIDPDEAARRIEHADQAQRVTDLKGLTVDLPAPIDERGFWESWDWDRPKYWVPSLIGGGVLSAVTAVLPASVLSAEHLFPQTGFGLAIGIVTLIMGIIGFFSCLAGIIVKAN